MRCDKYYFHQDKNVKQVLQAINRAIESKNLRDFICESNRVAGYSL